MNHCTWWPDSIGALDYAYCCEAHDIAYAGEGSRILADLDLARCVLLETGSALLALTMLAGVVTFGWAFRLVGRWRRDSNNERKSTQ